MAAIFLGQAVGLLRGVTVAHVFGASRELDAFFAANRVSETLFLLVAGGALGSAFIPTFTGLLAHHKKDAAWRLAAAIANAVALTLSLLALLTALFAPQIVRYALAPGLSTDPRLFALTIALLRTQLISAVLFGLGGLAIGILNAHQVFLVPALTPALYQLGIIFGAVVLSPSMGIYGLAWGVVLGSALYLVIQIPALLKLNDLPPRMRFSLGLRDPNVKEVLLLMGPRLLGVAVVQLNFWVNTWLASRMESGSVSGLYYGFSLMLMAQAVIAQSAAIAAMPTFSAQHALGQQDAMRSSLAATLRSVILLALPASAGLILLREPLISLLYQRGEFDQRAVQIVAWALLWYAVGMIGHSIMEILTRAFYAQRDTKTPVFIGSIAMGLNVVFSLTFIKVFEAVHWMPHGGLALANSLATALEAIALLILMCRRLGGLQSRKIVLSAVQGLAASLVMALGLWFWLGAAATQPAWIRTAGGLVIGASLYALIILLLGVEEARGLARALIHRMRRAA
jgi:putative peptidoglycan lipid II flippase